MNAHAATADHHAVPQVVFTDPEAAAAVFRAGWTVIVAAVVAEAEEDVVADQEAAAIPTKWIIERPSGNKPGPRIESAGLILFCRSSL